MVAFKSSLISADKIADVIEIGAYSVPFFFHSIAVTVIFISFSLREGAAMAGIRISKFNERTPRYDTLIHLTKGVMGFIVLVALLWLIFLPFPMSDREYQELLSIVNSKATEAAANQPQELKSYSSLDLNGLPPSLTEVITANLLTYTEIDSVEHTATIQAESSEPALIDVWCITIYPEAQLRLYTEPYPMNGNALNDQSGTQTIAVVGRITALERNNRWELYHPEAYAWNDLGC